MELLFGLIIDFVLELSVQDTDNVKIPRGIRIGLLILAILIYIAFIVFLVLLLMNAENTFVKVIIAGAVLFLTGMIISLWCRVKKTSREKLNKKCNRN